MNLRASSILCRTLLVSSILVPWTFAQSDSTFPGFAWGTPYSRIERTSRLLPTDLDERGEQVKVPIDSLGSARLEDCEFEFNNGYFSGIVIMTRGHRNTFALREYLEGRFGKGTLTETRFWQWLLGDTYLSLDEDSAGDGYVLWYGIPWQAFGENADGW